MEREVVVEIKTQYGCERIFPVNDTAQMFATLAGSKTLSHNDLRLVKGLGFSIVVVQKELKL